MSHMNKSCQARQHLSKGPEGSLVMHPSLELTGEERGTLQIWVNHWSPVRIRPNIRQLKSFWIWANRPSSKGFKLLFSVIKANKIKNQNQTLKLLPHLPTEAQRLVFRLANVLVSGNHRTTHVYALCACVSHDSRFIYVRVCIQI